MEASMKKAAQFALLYIYSLIVRILTPFERKPEGIKGEIVFLFWDPKYPENKHGVVAFVLPPGGNPDDYEQDLYGPFGYSSQISIKGLHLYGRDTWGTVNPQQIASNPALLELAGKHPNQIILLAGVRKVFGKHVPPLDKGKNFILVGK
jgi:hypothetical protein